MLSLLGRLFLSTLPQWIINAQLSDENEAFEVVDSATVPEGKTKNKSDTFSSFLQYGGASLKARFTAPLKSIFKFRMDAMRNLTSKRVNTIKSK